MSARASSLSGWYQIEVVTGRQARIREPKLDGNFTLINMQRVKVADIPCQSPTITLFRRAKDNKTAKRLGTKFGTVVACFKVSSSRFLESIENRDYNIPLEISIKPAFFTVDKDLNVSVGKDETIKVQITP